MLYDVRDVSTLLFMSCIRHDQTCVHTMTQTRTAHRTETDNTHLSACQTHRTNLQAMPHTHITPSRSSTLAVACRAYTRMVTCNTQTRMYTRTHSCRLRTCIHTPTQVCRHTQKHMHPQRIARYHLSASRNDAYSRSNFRGQDGDTRSDCWACQY